MTVYSTLRPELRKPPAVFLRADEDWYDETFRGPVMSLVRKIRVQQWNARGETVPPVLTAGHDRLLDAQYATVERVWGPHCQIPMLPGDWPELTVLQRILIELGEWVRECSAVCSRRVLFADGLEQALGRRLELALPQPRPISAARHAALRSDMRVTTTGQVRCPCISVIPSPALTLGSFPSAQTNQLKARRGSLFSRVFRRILSFAVVDAVPPPPPPPAQSPRSCSPPAPSPARPAAQDAPPSATPLSQSKTRPCPSS